MANVQSTRRMTFHERLVGAFVYMLGLAIAATFQDGMLTHHAWTTVVPTQIGTAMIGAGAAIAIWGWRK